MSGAVQRGVQTRELERLRARLAEAEETLTAIRQGEVDAIAVDGPRGRQIYTLQGADEPYRVLAESMSEGAASLTATGTILFCNQRLAEMTGRPLERLPGSRMEELLPASEHERFRDLLRQGQAGEARGETQFRRPDGRLMPVLVSLRSIPAGHEVGLCLVATDLRERKQAEEKIRFWNEQLEQRVASRTEELGALNRELESFNYAVAHDLRGPLRQIDGFAALLGEESEGALNADCQAHLTMIRDGVRRMSQLLEDLLSLSRLGRRELRKQPCGLKSLVEEVVAELTRETGERQIEWRIAELPRVECDRNLMKQVLLNLLSNALKFTRPRNPAIIEMGETMAQGQPAVFIRDNGVGFDMKYSDKLFGVFQRLHRAEEFEGTGVGLAVVQRIMHRHGGRVWAEGEVGRGATLYLSFPACEKKEAEAAAA